MELLMQNGTVVEGRGRFETDILVRDGRIAAMGKSLPVPAGGAGVRRGGAVYPPRPHRCPRPLP